MLRLRTWRVFLRPRECSEDFLVLPMYTSGPVANTV
jgi:hypothetical protein